MGELDMSGNRKIRATELPSLLDRSDRHLIWHTLCEGERCIKRAAIWAWSEPSVCTNLAVDTQPGVSRLSGLFELGDALDGHQASQRSQNFVTCLFLHQTYCL